MKKLNEPNTLHKEARNMNKPATPFLHLHAGRRTLAAFAGALLLVRSAVVLAQCPAPVLTSGLQTPMGAVLSSKGDLLVSEVGSNTPNSGRISIVDLQGLRRTLLSGLPSGLNEEGENRPSGAAGLFMRGRTLYVAIGVGDSILLGPAPGTARPNPNPSSPLFSSVLAIQFSAAVEKMTNGFALSPADHQTLASRNPVTLTNSAGERITVELVVNFPNFTAEPRPDYPENVRNSNPFGVVAVGNKLYVSDGGQNSVHQVNLATGAFSVLVSFPPIPNPAFNPNDPRTGGPTVEGVPTGIHFADGKLLVTLFRGYPFAAGTSAIVQVDPQNGGVQPFISGLKTAIDVLPITSDNGAARRDTAYLVLQHASDPVLTPPGALLRFDGRDSRPVGVANCLVFPTAMALDDRTGTLYVTQLTGTIVSIPVGAENYSSAVGLSPAVLNASTRGLVQTNDNVLIGGFIVGAGAGGGDARVVVRAIGPTLANNGVAGVLADPVLELHGSDGALLGSNNNWKDRQQAELEATGLAPTNDAESAIVTALPPGNYTTIVRGANGSSGVGLVEVYALQ